MKRALHLLPILLLSACGPAQKNVVIRPVEIRAGCDYDGYMGQYSANQDLPALANTYLAQAQACVVERPYSGSGE